MEKGSSKSPKTITAADIILIVLLLAACGAFLYFHKRALSGNTVRIYIDNEQAAVFPLDRDTVYTAATDLGTNTIHIEGGLVYVTDADCPDKICEQMGTISAPGEVIVCLPHRLIIEVSDEQ